MRVQHRVNFGAEQKIGKTDYAGANPHRPVDAARAHRGNAVNELSLAKRRKFRIAIGAVHGIALQVHRGADVMTACVDVLLDLVQQIARAAVPQMMVRIDDRHRRIDRILAPLGKPVFADGEENLLLHLGFADLDGHHSSLARTFLRELASSVKRVVFVGLLHARARDDEIQDRRNAFFVGGERAQPLRQHLPDP